jgi:hypothetical protein
MRPPSLSDLRTDEVNRRPVWCALSDLFLDTEITPNTIAYIAQTLHSSPYSLEECEYILWHEVYPVCIRNMYSVAGEWVYFDEDWLVSRITARARLLPKWWIMPARMQLGRWMLQVEWEQVLVVYATLDNN